MNCGTRSASSEPGPTPGLDGWVDVEDLVDTDTDSSSDTGSSDSYVSTAAGGPLSAMGVSVPPGFSRILNEGWQGLSERFSR